MNESCYETITFTNLNFAVFNFSAKIEVKSLLPKNYLHFAYLTIQFLTALKLMM